MVYFTAIAEGWLKTLRLRFYVPESPLEPIKNALFVEERLSERTAKALLKV